MIDRMDIEKTVEANTSKIEVIDKDIVIQMMNTLQEEHDMEITSLNEHKVHLEGIIDQMGKAFIDLRCIDKILDESDELPMGSPEALVMCPGMSKSGIVCVNARNCYRHEEGIIAAEDEIIDADYCMSSLAGDQAYEFFLAGIINDSRQ